MQVIFNHPFRKVPGTYNIISACATGQIIQGVWFNWSRRKKVLCVFTLRIQVFQTCLLSKTHGGQVLQTWHHRDSLKAAHWDSIQFFMVVLELHILINQGWIEFNETANSLKMTKRQNYYIMFRYTTSLLVITFLNSHLHICICSTFLHCAFLNVSSKCLPEKINIHIDCIWLTFFPIFSSVLFQMCPQITCPKGCIVKLAAFVWLFSTVSFQICPQMACLRRCKFTLLAFVWLFSSACPQITCPKDA